MSQNDDQQEKSKVHVDISNLYNQITSFAATLSVCTVILNPQIAHAAEEIVSSGPPAWLPIATFLAGPVLGLFELVMLVRVPLAWFPATEAKLPWVLLVKSTEPLLSSTRKVIPPQGGVDVSPIVWFAISSLARELLIGPQGILILLQSK